MATRRRDVVPGKEKRAIPSRNPSLSTKTSTTASPSHPKLRLPTSRAPTTTNVSKQLGKKPSSSHSPALDRTKPLERKAPSSVSQTQKTTTQKTTRVTTANQPPRSSSLSGKTAASQKPVQEKEKNVKTQTTDAGKRLSMHARPVSTMKKVGTDIKKQGTQNAISAINIKKPAGSRDTSSAIKGQSNGAPVHEKVEHIDVSEVKSHDEETFLTEIDDLIIEHLESKNDKGIAELLLTENNDKDAEMVTADTSTVSEHQDAIGIKAEVAGEEPCIEEANIEEHRLEEDATDEISNSNTVGSVVDNTDRAKDEVVEEEEDTEINEKEEALAGGRDAHEFHETDGWDEVEETKQEPENAVQVEENKQELEDAPSKQQIVEENKHELENEPPKEAVMEKKQESENAPSKQVDEEKNQETEIAAPRLQVQWKKGDSPVLNDKIEETASKVREQRKNKVKALAWAFESVMALQESN